MNLLYGRQALHKKVLLRFISFSLLNLTSCQTETPQPTTESVTSTVDYTIEMGNHYCNNNVLAPFKLPYLQFSATFDESAIYETKSQANQADINKLLGFSDCGTFHQENSARFGWTWQNNALHIFAYVYKNGQRTSKEITTVPLYEETEYRLEKQNGQYLFTVNRQHLTSIEAGCTESGNAYKLYPYFGGDEAAPHTVHIRIRETQ